MLATSSRNRRAPLAVGTKIVATVGPASESPQTLERLARAGADVFRLNFAHGEWDWHSNVVRRVQAVSQRLGVPLAILQDLGGPKLRLGEIPGGVVQCHAGDHFVLTREPRGQPNELTCSYDGLVDDLHEGDLVLFADGTVGMRVEAKAPGTVALVVTLPGELRSRQGVATPHARLQLEALTPKDLSDLDWTARHPVDFVGLSFVRRAADVLRLREELRRRGSQAQIIAKIEKAEALACLDDIIRVSDAIMVARGDLGIEIDVARVPLEQKRIIDRCRRLGVPVITATQMLESMRLSSRPTRAEASDVANAILDGTDAIMLSGETASGQYPVEAVEVMNRIAAETERALPGGEPLALEQTSDDHIPQVVRATANAAGVLAQQAGARLIAVATRTGRAALAVAKRRNATPCVGISDQPEVVRRMALYWGVLPTWQPTPPSPVEHLERVTAWALAERLVTVGDRIIFMLGSSWAEGGHNTLLVHEVRSAARPAPREENV